MSTKAPEKSTKITVNEKKSVKLPSSSLFSTDGEDQFVEEHAVDERIETTMAIEEKSTQKSITETTHASEKMLDGTVVKRRKVLANFVQNVRKFN
jgi:hypothetical protein